MTPFIVVKVRVTGFHCWPEAPKKVKFLASQHRHTFRIEVMVVPKHTDREVEFTLLKREIQAYLEHYYPKKYDGYDFGSRSCEMLSEELATELLQQRLQVKMVTFSEDDEFIGGVSC